MRAAFAGADQAAAAVLAKVGVTDLAAYQPPTAEDEAKAERKRELARLGRAVQAAPPEEHWGSKPLSTPPPPPPF
eukprot:5504835-Pyramimonas_sp.AAC.1